MSKRIESHNMQVLQAIKEGRDPKTIQRSPRDPREGPTESQIQTACMDWFKLQYRQLWEDGMLYHIANEGIRLGGQGRRAKREGIVRGVADLCLSVPRHGYGALYIEMKRPGCYQSPEQKTWQKCTEKHGNKYVVCKSLQEFIVTVNRYLAQ